MSNDEPSPDRQAAMPKWLLYKIVGSAAIILFVTAAALIYAGILG